MVAVEVPLEKCSNAASAANFQVLKSIQEKVGSRQAMIAKNYICPFSIAVADWIS
jgi:hypothetical protein